MEMSVLSKNDIRLALFLDSFEVITVTKRQKPIGAPSKEPRQESA